MPLIASGGAGWSEQWLESLAPSPAIEEGCIRLGWEQIKTGLAGNWLKANYSQLVIADRSLPRAPIIDHARTSPITVEQLVPRSPRSPRSPHPPNVRLAYVKRAVSPRVGRVYKDRPYAPHPLWQCILCKVTSSRYFVSGHFTV